MRVLICTAILFIYALIPNIKVLNDTNNGLIRQATLGWTVDSTAYIRGVWTQARPVAYL